ncbi:hypothetical protein ACRQ1B_23415 [Rhizobium panacihumi]|uniref:hypothetical protein n=1 Tax=Rhizobium panacihumi TaxID=2008450 RepID=UPI003D7AC875
MAGKISGNGNVPANVKAERGFINWLAVIVFLCSFVGLLGVAAGAVFYGQPGEQTFNILTPLFGTWVGTVLTFYFTRENFKEANDAVSKIMERVTPAQVIDQMPVRDAMKPRAKIQGHILKENGEEDTLRLSKLRDLIREGCSRILIFAADGTIKYVIHESTLNKFIADRILHSAGQTAPQQNPVDATLAQLLLYKPVEGKLSMAETVRLFSFVGEAATLADARVAMTSTPGCEDVFVTKTGKASEPVLGWLTNSDITRQI